MRRAIQKPLRRVTAAQNCPRCPAALVFGQWLSRQKLVRVCRLIRKRRDDYRHLLQIRFLNAFVEVHVVVVRARFVLDGVLNELKSGQADLVERATLALTYHESDRSTSVTRPCGPNQRYGGVHLRRGQPPARSGESQSAILSRPLRAIGIARTTSRKCLQFGPQHLLPSALGAHTQAFPVLTAAQIDHILPMGEVRQVQRGNPFYVFRVTTASFVREQP